MTPKEKANSLVDKYYEDDLMWEDLSYIQAKKCALIAVDEILNQLDAEIWGLEMDRAFDRQSYWQQVKQEIEKL